jgi:striatin 1/3/4
VLVPASLGSSNSNLRNNTNNQQPRNNNSSSSKNKPILSSPKQNNANLVSSPIPKKSTLQHQYQEQEQEEDNMEVPANVDEVAMINNIKEETENYNSTHQKASMAISSSSSSSISSPDLNESLVKCILLT